MKKILLIILCFICICGCSNNKNKVDNNDDVKEKIIANFNKMLDVSDQTSSNPYDYTKNEYYDNIVNIGEEVVPVLEDMHEHNELSSLEDYISILIIQDVIKCNLKEKYEWSTVDEFYSLFEKNNCLSK